MTETLPYAPGSDTSRAAAQSMQAAAPRQRGRVLAFIAGTGPNGATCAEVEAALGMSHQAASARMRELKADRAIVDTGLRRATPSGRTAAAWRSA